MGLRRSPGDHPGRARRERCGHLLGGRHLRERRHLERDLANLVARSEIVVGELACGRAARRYEPARGAEDGVALVVGANRLRRAIGHLRIRAGVTQVAHRSQVEHCRPTPLAHPRDEFARDAEHLGRIVPVGDLVANLLPGGQRRFDPAGRAGHADPEAVVLAHEEQRQRKTLVGDLGRRIEGRLRRGVVERGIAEGAEDDGVVAPGTRHLQARGAVDGDRHPDGARKMRRDRRGHRDDRELLPAEDLVPAARDRLERGGDHTEHDVAQPVDLGPRGTSEVERAGAVVEQRRVVDAQCERDGGIRLVPRRADRVEAPPVLLEPAGRVVRLPAVDLRAPDLSHLGRSLTQRGARLEGSQGCEQVLLERVELESCQGRHGRGRASPQMIDREFTAGRMTATTAPDRHPPSPSRLTSLHGEGVRRPAWS